VTTVKRVTTMAGSGNVDERIERETKRGIPFLLFSSPSDQQQQESSSSSSPTSPSPPTSPSSMSVSERIIEAAAEMTNSQSSLLGTKSLGVDYGLVRTGIAISNGYNPQPLSILSHLNNTQLSNQIIKYVEIENAHQIVMGLPFHKNGTEAEQTVITRNYASQLNCAVCAHFGYDVIPIYLWDERYTSKEAESRIRAVNPNAGLLYKDLDADSASIILEYYYGDNGRGAEKVHLPENKDIRDAIDIAWNMRKEEKHRELQALMEHRKNAGNNSVKLKLMEKARLLDEKLANESGNSNGSKKNKKKKKKKKPKRKYIHLTPNMDMNTNMNSNSSGSGSGSDSGSDSDSDNSNSNSNSNSNDSNSLSNE
jgi:putative Holliday junction resolvase